TGCLLSLDFILKFLSLLLQLFRVRCPITSKSCFTPILRVGLLEPQKRVFLWFHTHLKTKSDLLSRLWLQSCGTAYCSPFVLLTLRPLSKGS
ncbi:hypothetical protein LDENG_00112010, partial [Lucifuga dentata]